MLPSSSSSSSSATLPLTPSASTADSRHGNRSLLRFGRSKELTSDLTSDKSPLSSAALTGIREALPDRIRVDQPTSEHRFSRRGPRGQRVNSILDYSSRALNYRFQALTAETPQPPFIRAQQSHGSFQRVHSPQRLSTNPLDDTSSASASSLSRSKDDVLTNTLPHERQRTQKSGNPLRRPRASRVMSNVDHLFRRDYDSKRSLRHTHGRPEQTTSEHDNPDGSTSRKSTHPASLSLGFDTHPISRSAVRHITGSATSQSKTDLSYRKGYSAHKAGFNHSFSVTEKVFDSSGQREERVSADAACPMREKEQALANLGRSQSTPAKRTAKSKFRGLLKLSPLMVPRSQSSSNNSNVHFKFVRDSSGKRQAIKEDSIIYVGLRNQDNPSNASITGSTDQSPRVRSPQSPNRVTSSLSPSSRSSPITAANSTGALGVRSVAPTDIWNGAPRRTASGWSGNVDNHFTEADQRLYEQEYSALSTTSSATALSNSNKVREAISPLAEVTEDSFILQIEDTYIDGGFVISLNGLEGTPEKLVRKVSNGFDIDGVPTSSRNLIIVRSFDEFTRISTIRGNGTLGTGITGSVYLARHEPTGKKVAVKRINAFDEKKREQLKKELTTLISHESRFLVRSHGAFYDGKEGVHIVLEYMDRGSLDDVVSMFGKIPESVLRRITEHCLRGLKFLHENHVLHRDVKTGNILLSRRLGRAKLGDFGLARDLKESNPNANSMGEGSTSETKTFVGTFAYMSPERLHGDSYTYASDIWGLGMVVVECALGRPPFDSLHQYFDIVQAVEGTPPASLVEGKVSGDLVDFIRLSTAHNPTRRQTASQLLKHRWIEKGRDDPDALRRWLHELPGLHHDIVSERSGGSVRAQARQLERMRETNQLR